MINISTSSFYEKYVKRRMWWHEGDLFPGEIFNSYCDSYQTDFERRVWRWKSPYLFCLKYKYNKLQNTNLSPFILLLTIMNEGIRHNVCYRNFDSVLVLGNKSFCNGSLFYAIRNTVCKYRFSHVLILSSFFKITFS